jgi:hypothetical protein
VALPMLSKFKLWEALGDALNTRAWCYWEMDNALDAEVDTAASLDAYIKASVDSKISSARLKLAGLFAKKGDWSGVAFQTGLVVDDVLQMFASWYPNALGLCSLAKAQLGAGAEALELTARLFEIKDLELGAAAHGYHAQAIVLGGVKGRNLAAKAMKGYLAVGLVDEAKAASALI